MQDFEGEEERRMIVKRQGEHYEEADGLVNGGFKILDSSG